MWIRSLLARRSGRRSSRNTTSSTDIVITYRLSRPLTTRTCRISGKYSFLLLPRCSLKPRSGTVDSKLRQLVMKLEYVESLLLAHPFVKGFDRTSYCLSPDEVGAVAQGDNSESISKRTLADIQGKEGASIVYTTTFYIGLQIEPKQGGQNRLEQPRRTDKAFQRARQALENWIFLTRPPSLPRRPRDGKGLTKRRWALSLGISRGLSFSKVTCFANFLIALRCPTMSSTPANVSPSLLRSARRHVSSFYRCFWRIPIPVHRAQSQVTRRWTCPTRRQKRLCCSFLLFRPRIR